MELEEKLQTGGESNECEAKEEKRLRKWKFHFIINSAFGTYTTAGDGHTIGLTGFLT